MERKLSFTRGLVIATAFIAAALIAAGSIYAISSSSGGVDPMAAGRPRIGNAKAKVELLVIEDFRCGACQYFTEEIFPRIYKKYIQTGRACCVMVPVSFLDGSQPLANAALAVYQLAPDLFLSYLHSIMEFFNGRDANGDVSQQLVALAKQLNGIDVDRFRHLIETNRFTPELEQNLEWAKRLMGKHFGTPALFINGVRISAASIEAIEALIEKVEK